LGDELGALVGRAAVGVLAAAVLLLGLGLLAELLRRRHRARRVLRFLDLTLPLGVRTAVVALHALVATVTGSAPVGASDSVRGWLGQAEATTTTSRVVVATSDGLSERATTPTAPSDPVILIPPATVERLEAPSPAAPAAPAAAEPRPAPAPRPVTPGRSYVVQRGDCLWSIAARILGSDATAPAIDAGWRRIYAANRVAIGDNPNLIHIGLTLELPPLVAQS
jgi:hypothetical protein